jgi:hypothetical protein
MKFQCTHCGQHLEGDEDLAGASIDCPACQKPFMIPSAAAVRSPEPTVLHVAHSMDGGNKKMSGLAVASLVLGSAGMLFGVICCGIPMSAIGIVVGHMAFSQTNGQPERYTGRGLAVAGLVTSYVGLLVGIGAGIAFGVYSAMMNEMLEQLNRALQVPAPRLR